MFSIAVNSNNDIYLGADGNLATVNDEDAVRQGCEHAMKAQLGEMNLALQRGVPTLNCIWNFWRPAQFIAASRRMLSSVPNVTAVLSFILTREDGVASYTATIENTFTDAAMTISGDLTT